MHNKLEKKTIKRYIAAVSSTTRPGFLSQFTHNLSPQQAWLHEVPPFSPVNLRILKNVYIFQKSISLLLSFFVPLNTYCRPLVFAAP